MLSSISCGPSLTLLSLLCCRCSELPHMREPTIRSLPASPLSPVAAWALLLLAPLRLLLRLCWLTACSCCSGPWLPWCLVPLSCASGPLLLSSSSSPWLLRRECLLPRCLRVMDPFMPRSLALLADFPVLLPPSQLAGDHVRTVPLAVSIPRTRLAGRHIHQRLRCSSSVLGCSVPPCDVAWQDCGLAPRRCVPLRINPSRLRWGSLTPWVIHLDLEPRLRCLPCQSVSLHPLMHDVPSQLRCQLLKVFLVLGLRIFRHLTSGGLHSQLSIVVPRVEVMHRLVLHHVQILPPLPCPDHLGEVVACKALQRSLQHPPATCITPVPFHGPVILSLHYVPQLFPCCRFQIPTVHNPAALLLHVPSFQLR